MSGIPIVCGIHQCPPDECFEKHYPDAHRVEQACDDNDAVLELALEHVCEMLEINNVGPIGGFTPKTKTLIKMIIAAAAPIIEDALARKLLHDIEEANRVQGV